MCTVSQPLAGGTPTTTEYCQRKILIYQRLNENLTPFPQDALVNAHYAPLSRRFPDRTRYDIIIIDDTRHHISLTEIEFSSRQSA